MISVSIKWQATAFRAITQRAIIVICSVLNRGIQLARLGCTIVPRAITQLYMLTRAASLTSLG